jgi:hypothetical protein
MIINIPWNRTANGEYPNDGTMCFIYFTETRFSISEYTYEDGNHVFSDCGGFLGDEDILWVALDKLPAIGGNFNRIAIPQWYPLNPKDKELRCI